VQKEFRRRLIFGGEGLWTGLAGGGRVWTFLLTVLALVYLFFLSIADINCNNKLLYFY
jgi:hypothetical protein